MFEMTGAHVPTAAVIEEQVVPVGHPLPPLPRQPSPHVPAAVQTRPLLVFPHCASVRHMTHFNVAASHTLLRHRSALPQGSPNGAPQLPSGWQRALRHSVPVAHGAEFGLRGVHAPAGPGFAQYELEAHCASAVHPLVPQMPPLHVALRQSPAVAHTCPSGRPQAPSV